LLKPLREYLIFLSNEVPSTRLVLLTPSVNLFPIPFSILSGSFCGDFNAVSVVTGDVAAAVELNHEITAMTLPNRFIGLGNPMPKSGLEIAINLGSLGVLRGQERDLNKTLDTLPALPEAVNEVVEISEFFEQSDLFLNDKASIADALQVAVEANSMEQSSLINLATHAFAVDYSGDMNLPAMLTIKSNDLGVVTANEIGIYDLRDSYVFLSACNTAVGNLERSDLYFSGFVEGFANAGSKLITASLWPVKSIVAKQHSVDFIEGFMEGNFLSALKKVDGEPMSYDKAPFVVVYP
jgi:CHAT domain-containing protein